MELNVNRLDPGQSNAGGQTSIGAAQPRPKRARLSGIKMDHLSYAMHAGVSATSGNHSNRMIGYKRQGRLDNLLHGGLTALILPAMKLATIIFHTRCVARTL